MRRGIVPFVFSKHTHQKLCELNDVWRERMSLAWQWSPPWAFGGQVTREIRGCYESFFPLQIFLDELASLGRDVLISKEWLPTILKNRNLPIAKGFIFPDSYPDFCNFLPESMQPIFPLTEDKLLQLFCVLADPPHYGTNTGRYDKQIASLQDWLTNCAKKKLRIVDLGCGTGAGTYEIENELAKCDILTEITGVTLEYLECWMATEQNFPNNKRTKSVDLDKLKVIPDFVVADIFSENWGVGIYDIVFCNGLIGGPVCCEKMKIDNFFMNLDQYLADDGVAFLANNFHDGYLLRFSKIIKDLKLANKWRIFGSPKNLVISRLKIM